MARVFVVDDEMTMVQTVTELLREEGHEVFPFNNGQDAVEALEGNAPDLVVTDLFLQRTHPQGLELLQKARSLQPPAIVIVITGYASIETAVEAMKKGAFDYLEKPFKPDDFKLCVGRALSYNKAISENLFLRKQLREKYRFSEIIGNSIRLQDVYRLMEKVADTDSTILILGESGTGKELVARALHFNSRRQLAPFIPINCSALPENLLESELFGHRKGAFTGAIIDKKGLFQEAEGGTIFLDEVGSMPPVLQSRLLRVLQDREVRRVGDNTPVYVNVRVLAATNEPLEKRITDGTFREDLFYRLNVIPIHLPSLRDRMDDIPLLVKHFLKRKVDIRSGETICLTRQALQVLGTHHWPGNVRELENAIERGSALCENNLIRIRDLPPVLQDCAGRHHIEEPQEGVEPAPLPAPTAQGSSFSIKSSSSSPGSSSGAGSAKVVCNLKDFLREQEVAYLNRAMILANNDKERAASMLGISLATLYRKMAGEDTASKP
jgi:DNA-binding NtrC family response regulator